MLQTTQNEICWLLIVRNLVKQVIGACCFMLSPSLVGIRFGFPQQLFAVGWVGGELL